MPRHTPARRSDTLDSAEAPPHRPDRARAALVALFAGSTLAHLLRPGWFVPLIPDWVPGDPEVVHDAATAAEGVTALLLARRRTARLGGWLAAAVLVGVFPANVEAARRGGYRLLPGVLGGPVVAWLRLPLQVPPIIAALRVARGGAGGVS